MASVAVKSICGTNSSGVSRVVAADLVDPQRDRLVLVRVLALDHQHRDAVDEKDHILPRAVVAVVKGKLLGHFVNVAPCSRR